MKAYFLMLLMFPLFCFSQEDRGNVASKPSTTDCPSWKKKDKKAGKAEYFQYLRTGKPQSGKQTNYANTTSKVQPNTVPQRTKNSEQKEELQVAPKQPEESQIVADKPKKAKRITTNSSDEVKPVISSATELKTKETPVNAKKEEKNVPAVPKEDIDEPKAVAGTSENSEAEKEDKLKDEKTKLKQKLTRLTRKTTKVRKHSNAKCPSF